MDAPRGRRPRRTGSIATRALSWVLAGLVAAGLPAACAEPSEGASLVVEVAPGDRVLFEDFIAFLDDPRVELVVRSDGDAPSSATQRVRVHADLDCTDCYRLAFADGAIDVHGSTPLGVQYGLADALERQGYRFFHPQKILRPAALGSANSEGSAEVEAAPVMTRRGLHAHTLHTTEAFHDLWEPGPDNLHGAKRLVDWLIKNRGNYLQWVALDDIQGDEAVAAAWQEHTRQILDYAHARGIETGLGIQVFGSGNLQHAFDLLDRDNEGEPIADAVRQRMAPVTPALPFDTLSLSFGEFFREDPDAFVDSVGTVHQTLLDLDPEIDTTGTIHVGNSEDLRVEYRGESLQYYFLAQFVDPLLRPLVHTVMFYNLFEDAGLAYDHEVFDEHRAFLLEQLERGAQVGYHPESAYWVAFDNSVPTYLPLYVRSRWLDVARIDELATAGGFAPLGEQVLFSTGWEWGYWQNDYATLRLGFSLPPSPEAIFVEMFAAYGPAGEELGRELARLADDQATYLIDRRLAPHLAGRDTIIDLGDEMGIHSQPDRPSFAEILAMDAGARAAATTDVIGGLDACAAAHDTHLGAIEALALPADDAFLSEIRDGIAVTAERSRFAAAILRAVVAYAGGGAMDQDIDHATTALDRARTIVSSRHEALHDPDPAPLLGQDRNATLYQYGYLHYADSLCYWQRELAQLLAATTTPTTRVPACFRF